MKIKERKKTVTKILQTKEDCRDDDNKLIANYWWHELKKMGVDMAIYDPLLKVLASGKLSNTEAITRCRRKLQEHNPNLRGDIYDKRQRHKKDVKEEIKNW